MIHSQLYRRVLLAAAAAALLAVAGCKSEPASEATNQPSSQPKPASQPAKKTSPAKPASTKSASAKPAPAKAAAAKPAPAKATSAKSNAPARAKAPAKTVPVSAKSTQPPHFTDMTVPKGTAITATVGQSLTSDKNHTGDKFVATLSAPITVDGKTVLPKGAHVTGKVVAVGKHDLKLTLASIVVHGKSYDLATNSVHPADRTQLKLNAPADDGDDASAEAKPKKDNGSLSAKTHLMFKLAKPVTVPVKG